MSYPNKSGRGKRRLWLYAASVAALALASCTQNQLPLNLVKALNNDGIASAGGKPDSTNFGHPDAPEGSRGNGYPGELLPEAGGRLALAGRPRVQFVFPGNRPGVANNFTCEWQRLRVPKGRYSAAYILGACDRPGEQAQCAFKYERKREDHVLGFSSWLDTEPQAGDLGPLRLPYHYEILGVSVKAQPQPCTMWVQKFDLDPERVLRNISFTYNNHVHVFAITLLTRDWTPDHTAYVREMDRSYELLRGDVRAAYVGYVKRAKALRADLANLPQAVRDRLPRPVQWAETAVRYAESLLPEKRCQISAEERGQIEAALAQAALDVKDVARGWDPFIFRRNVVLKSYRSPLDDTVQPYAVFVPEDYTRQKKWPLVVRLHGHRWYRPFQGYPDAEEVAKLPKRAIVLFPHARGSLDYMLQSEQDVLDTIEAVKRDYLIDENRVYLTGRSMGGTGTWNLGVKFADRFAALAPLAGNTDSRVWERVWGWSRPGRSALGEVKAKVAYAADPVTYAANLLDLPVFCIHGGDDRVVPVAHSRSMIMEVWQQPGKYYFEYREPQRASHSTITDELVEEQTEWLLKQKRVERPKHVRLKASKLRYAKAYWVRIDALEAPLEYADVSAKAKDTGELDLQVAGAAALTIDIDASPACKAASLTVSVNDAVAFQGNNPQAPKMTLVRGADGKWAPGQPPTGMVKKAGLEGPVEDAFLSPFVLVYGTGGSAFDKSVAKSEAERFAADWKRVFGEPCRMKADADVTDADIAALNLVLYGGPGCNAVTARVMDKLPIRVEPGQVRVGDKVFKGEDVGVKFCYPNPLNPERYVVVLAGATWRGMYQIMNRFGNWFHWGLFDNRNWFDYGVFDDRTHSPETFLCFGFFDSNWAIDAKHQWQGVDAERKAARPRRLPRYASVFELGAKAAGPNASSRKRLYLSDLLPTLIDQHKGVANSDMSFEGGPLHVGDKPYAKGIGVRAPSELVFQLDGRFERFAADVGVDMEGEAKLTDVRKKFEWIRFEVYGDGARLYRSDWLQGDSKPRLVRVPVAGVSELRLKVEGSWARWHLGSAAWGDVRVMGQGW